MSWYARREVSRSSGSRAPQLVTLAPVPRWICELAGHELEQVAAWTTDDAGVWIRGSTTTGEALSLQLTDRPDGTLRCFHVAPADRGGLLRRLAPRTRRWSDVERFVERMRWVASLEDGVGAAAPYEASARERLLGRAIADLARIREPEDARRCAPEELSTDDPALRGIGLYLDVLAERWDRVLTAGAAPAWLAPTLLALRGDVEAVQALGGGAPWRGEGVLANVMGMAFERVGCDDAGWAAYAEGVRSVPGPERADLCLALSKLGRARGEVQGSVTWARRALLARNPSDDVLRRACRELVRAGALDDAYVVLLDRCTREPIDPKAALDLAELLVWAGRTREARPWLERVEGSSGDALRELRCMGALLALERRWPEALEVLSRAESLRPRDMEVTAWLSEVHLRMGDRAEAELYLASSRAGEQNAIHVALDAVVHGADRTELSLLLEGLGEPPLGADRDPAEVGWELLSTFGGNRSEVPTRRGHAVDGLGIELVRLSPRRGALSSRAESAAVLRSIGTAPSSVLEQKLEELSEAYPASPHPLCYWAELNLWLGRYERAIELCDRALGRERARWAYVGKAAAMILRGEHERADAELAECARFFTPVAGATTDVYLGESHRKRGDYTSALAHLHRAVEVKPGRVGAWMNLALTHLARGAPDDAEPIIDMLLARWPGMYWDAWYACFGQRAWPIPRSEVPGLFETALALMRGNRSSHTITYFDADGAFRVAQSVDRWREPLARHARFIAMELRTRLVLGVED